MEGGGERRIKVEAKLETGGEDRVGGGGEEISQGMKKLEVGG